jgi:hypothetical protein
LRQKFIEKTDMVLRVPELSDGGVAALVEEINRRGFGVIPEFIGASDLAKMRNFVKGAIDVSKGEYAGFIGPEAVSGSGLDELARTRSFREMVERIYECASGQKPLKQDFYQVLRCLTGESALRHSYLFHYDSYLVTVLIPIEIPTAGLTGDFLILPNTRRVRKNYASNVIDKILLDNPATQFALRKLTKMQAIKPIRIKMVPGTAYFFWGYRSVHTNEPCDAGQVRATALFHYANPHAGAAIGSMPGLRSLAKFRR